LSDPTNLLWLGLGIALGGTAVHLIRFSARVVDAVLDWHIPNSTLGELLARHLPMPESFQDQLAQVPRQRDRRGRHAVRRR
jgi:hypothetical protein